MARPANSGLAANRERAALVACSLLSAPPAVAPTDYALPHIAEELARADELKALRDELRSRGLSWVDVLEGMQTYHRDRPMPINDLL